MLPPLPHQRASLLTRSILLPQYAQISVTATREAAFDIAGRIHDFDSGDANSPSYSSPSSYDIERSTLHYNAVIVRVSEKEKSRRKKSLEKQHRKECKEIDRQAKKVKRVCCVSSDRHKPSADGTTAQESNRNHATETPNGGKVDFRTAMEHSNCPYSSVQLRGASLTRSWQIWVADIVLAFS